MSIDASDVFIQTPMVRSLHNTLSRWVWCNFTGGLIVGDARLGKSWATRALGDTAMSAEGEPVRLFHIGFGPRDQSTIRAVYARVARAIGHDRITNATRADELQAYLFHAFAEAALSNQRRQVILLVDEAQELTVEQLGAFAEIFNDQDRVKNRLMVVFIANTQKFTPLAKQLLEVDNQYLRERFFHNIHHFYGIRSLAELKQCLTFFDHHWLNADNTQSIVDHYCPEMRAEGMSLADLSELCWEIYDERYAKPLQLQSWGMTYFQRAISILLMDYLAHYWRNDEATHRALIEKSIAASGIVPNLRSIEG
jgi:hypothetical protein